MPIMRLGAFFIFFAVLCALTGTAHASKYASIVIEAQSGRILHAVQPYQTFHPASMTKLMTLYMTFEALKKGKLTLEQEVPVSEKASKQPSSKLWLPAGDKVAVRDLILSLIIRSANDASVVLAEAIAGTEEDFARLMTKKAFEMGMSSTQFYNSSGLYHKAQVSTPRDMALLVRRLMTDYPEYYPLFGERSFKFRGQKIVGHNSFLNYYKGADGLKTGYIDASGYNLAASATRDGTRLIAIVFGGLDRGWRDQHMAKLMDYGFYQVQKIAQRREKSREIYETRLPDRNATSTRLRLSQPAGVGVY